MFGSTVTACRGLPSFAMPVTSRGPRRTLDNQDNSSSARTCCPLATGCGGAAVAVVGISSAERQVQLNQGGSVAPTPGSAIIRSCTQQVVRWRYTQAIPVCWPWHRRNEPSGCGMQLSHRRKRLAGSIELTLAVPRSEWIGQGAYGEVPQQPRGKGVRHPGLGIARRLGSRGTSTSSHHHRLEKPIHPPTSANCHQASHLGSRTPFGGAGARKRDGRGLGARTQPGFASVWWCRSLIVLTCPSCRACDGPCGRHCGRVRVGWGPGPMQTTCSGRYAFLY